MAPLSFVPVPFLGHGWHPWWSLDALCDFVPVPQSLGHKPYKKQNKNRAMKIFIGPSPVLSPSLFQLYCLIATLWCHALLQQCSHWPGRCKGKWSLWGLSDPSCSIPHLHSVGTTDRDHPCHYWGIFFSQLPATGFVIICCGHWFPRCFTTGLLLHPRFGKVRLGIHPSLPVVQKKIFYFPTNLTVSTYYIFILPFLQEAQSGILWMAFLHFIFKVNLRGSLIDMDMAEQ